MKRSISQKGIAVVGNAVVDVIKEIPAYPKVGNLTTITHIEQTTGGACANCLGTIARMDPSVLLQAVCLVGDDDYGSFYRKRLEEMGIDCSHVKQHPHLATSFSDVMTGQGGAERTFFHYMGANGALSPSFIDFDTIQADIFHYGYILLLDAMDQLDDEYGTVLARTLAMAQARGMKTSVDIVSEQSDRYRELVPPSLRYTDYCIINEVEASKTVGIPCRDEGDHLLLDKMETICRRIRKMGVSCWTVIHAPEGSFALDEAGQFITQPSLELPADYIKGKTGAGDAFCAAVLYGAYQHWPLEKALQIATAAAASCLSSTTAVDGILPVDDLWTLFHQYPKRNFI